MGNKLQEMSTVQTTETGVEVRLRGPVEKRAIEEMIGSCATGTHACCGPDFFARVEGIDVAGVDGDVAIQIRGKEVTEAMIQENLAVCDCYKG